MARPSPLPRLFPANVLAAHTAAWRGMKSPRARFSKGVLTNFSATAVARRPLAIRAEGNEPTEILLYDEIGYWGVTAKDFVLALAKVGDGPITLRINSPGGDVFDGYAIYNALKSRAQPVNVVVDGIAASAASFIAMAGASIEMAETSMLMIHNANGVCFGDRRDMAEMSDLLGKIDGQIASIYASKAGADAEIFAAAMDAETWYTSSDAKAVGLCDSVGGAASGAPVDPAARGFVFISNRAGKKTAQLPPYDPDEDGDNDAQEALDAITMARSHLEHAALSLSGGDGCEPDGEADPEARGRRRRPSAAATTPEWVCGAADDLPIDAEAAWDGPAAAERMLDVAGFNGESPDPALAKRGFLAWDHHNPKLKGSYKLPFADVVGGKLTALKSGIDAAASRLPDTDIPDGVKTSARSVLDAYKNRLKPPDDRANARLRGMGARLRLAEAGAD